MQVFALLGGENKLRLKKIKQLFYYSLYKEANKNKHFKHEFMFNYYFIIKLCNYVRGKDIHRVSFAIKSTSSLDNINKEVWWSRGSVPASGPPGPGSNLGSGPPHSVV